ncbi:MAG: hypothetical protein ACYDC1_11530 [Limisphaerales bacterium]
MNLRSRALWQIGLLIAVLVGLVLLFPPALVFVEMAARELRYLWWLILLVALGVWLIWASRRKSG